MMRFLYMIRVTLSSTIDTAQSPKTASECVYSATAPHGASAACSLINTDAVDST